MKATLYTTNEKNVFAKKALFYNNEKSDNLCVVSVSKTPMCESFTGFGVAITGSSCYELSLMPENVRNDFLNDIYGEPVRCQGFNRIKRLFAERIFILR